MDSNIEESEVEADSHEEMADIDDGIVTDEINPDSDDEKKKECSIWRRMRERWKR